MDKILAVAQVGSRSYNLADENSDNDLLIIGTASHFLDIKKMARPNYPYEDIHCISNMEYLIRFFTKEAYFQRIEDMSSIPVDDSNEIFIFLREHREEYIKANLQKIYMEYFQKINNRFTKTHYQIAPKTPMTCMRFLYTLNDYANSQNWQKSFWIEEPLRTELLKIKYKEKSYEQIFEEFNSLKTKVESLQDFYCVPQDEEYNEYFYREICKILEVPFECAKASANNLSPSRRTKIFDKFLS